MAVDTTTGTAIAGLDALELAGQIGQESLPRRLWAATWPKALAIGIVIGLWQFLYVIEWRPHWTWPSVPQTFGELKRIAGTEYFWHAVAVTMRRAAVGFTMAIVIGAGLGLAVARIKVLRAAIGSMITALQTMPSIAWFPLAIMVFQVGEAPMYFVIVLGAAPSIANGVIAGIDYVPPLLMRAGRNIGARGIDFYRHVVAPAALPSIVAGLKQGWAFSWRSLMAGELLVATGVPSLGFQLDTARNNFDAPLLMATMVVILVIGLAVDGVFGKVDRTLRGRRGLGDRAG